MNFCLEILTVPRTVGGVHKASECSQVENIILLDILICYDISASKRAERINEMIKMGCWSTRASMHCVFQLEEVFSLLTVISVSVQNIWPHRNNVF